MRGKNTITRMSTGINVVKALMSGANESFLYYFSATVVQGRLPTEADWLPKT